MLVEPRDVAIPTNLDETLRLVSGGTERAEEQADPNLPADPGPHLLAYREQVTPDDQAWPMQLFPKPEQPLRFIAYACAPFPNQDIYRLGLDLDEELLERVIVAITPDGLPVLSSHSYIPAHLAHNDHHHWRNTQIGQLALPGIPVQLADTRIWARIATLTETNALAINATPDTAPMNLVGCLLTINHQPHPQRAGLLIKAPGHRTYFSRPPKPTT